MNKNHLVIIIVIIAIIIVLIAISSHIDTELKKFCIETKLAFCDSFYDFDNQD
jgi:hypothetical protein